MIAIRNPVCSAVGNSCAQVVFPTGGRDCGWRRVAGALRLPEIMRRKQAVESGMRGKWRAGEEKRVHVREFCPTGYGWYL